MTVTVPEAVARGAALLDEKMPGWADRVDPATLNMSIGVIYADESPPDGPLCGCVGAQLAPWEGKTMTRDGLTKSWITTMHALGVIGDSITRDLPQAIEHGFYLSGPYNHPKDYERLTDLWREQIIARREGTS